MIIAIHKIKLEMSKKPGNIFMMFKTGTKPLLISNFWARTSSTLSYKVSAILIYNFSSVSKSFFHMSRLKRHNLNSSYAFRSFNYDRRSFFSRRVDWVVVGACV